MLQKSPQTVLGKLLFESNLLQLLLHFKSKVTLQVNL